MTVTALETSQSIQRVEGAVYRITLNRPREKNAFTPTLYREVKHGILTAMGTPEVQVIVIEGTEGSFAAGGDLKIFLDILRLPPPERVVAFCQAFEETLPFQTILDCPKPIIAKVDGLCLAGGLIVAATADVCIASDRSSFGVPEGHVGLADPFCAAVLPLVVGLPRARYMMMTGTRIDARTAQEWGLVLQVVSGDELDVATEALVAEFLTTAPESRSSYKRAANRFVPRMNPLTVLDVALTANGEEGLAAFSAKRRPDWEEPSYPF
jgi:enoyl-CoA hydratase/carnithine racemase